MEDFIGHFVRFQKEVNQPQGLVGSVKKKGYRKTEFSEKFYKRLVSYEEGVGLCIGREGLFYKIYMLLNVVSFESHQNEPIYLVEEEEILEVGRKMSIEECLTSESETIRNLGKLLKEKNV